MKYIFSHIFIILTIVLSYSFLVISFTNAATPVPPTLQSPANTWATTITTNSVNLTWSYTTLDPSIWFYLYILKWDSSSLSWKPYASKYVGVTLQDTESFTDGFYAWQLAAVDISQQSSPWYQWANDWNKLKVGAGATPTPSPAPTITPIPTGPTPTPAPTPVGPTLYISPTGSDNNNTNPCTNSASPCKTFSYVIPKLNPGDTLLLTDGQYTKSTTGLPNINCSSTGGNAKSGTDDAHRITIKAQNERRADLKSDGSLAALYITNCSYWDIIGLNMESADLPLNLGGGGFGVLDAEYNKHLRIKRNLVHNTNRYFNVGALDSAHDNDMLFEENEVYSFHRIGLETFGADSLRNTYRRNYVNSRDYPDLKTDATGHCNDSWITGGSNSPNYGKGPVSANILDSYCSSAYKIVNHCEKFNADSACQDTCSRTGATCSMFSIVQSTGDIGEHFYYSGDSVSENDIIEYTNDAEGIGDLRNKAYGVIAWGEGVGLYAQDQTSPVSYYENSIGIANNMGQAFKCNHCTVAAKNLTLYGKPVQIGYRGQNGSSASLMNTLFLNDSTSVAADSGDICSSDYGAFYPNTTHTNCTSNNAVTSAVTGMGLGSNQCLVYVPSFQTNLKGKGSSLGASTDIGANIIYRYQGEAGGTISLSSTKLWNQTTGQFPCGATVAGVNDDTTFPTSACVNVHKRLNVGVNGCPIP